MGKFGGGLRPPCGTIRGTFGRGRYVRSNVGPVEPLSTLRNRSELNVRLWVTSRHRLTVSALGQKRTFRSAIVMSALPPIRFVFLACYDAVSNHRLVSVHGGCVLTRKIRHRVGNEETILVASYLKTGVSTATAPRKYGTVLVFERMTVRGSNCPAPPWSRTAWESRVGGRVDGRDSFISTTWLPLKTRAAMPA